jgi:hypothetical protein
MIKPKLLVFSMINALEKPTTEGLKFVLFRISDGNKTLGHEYGFANWTGKEWEEVDPSASVFMGAEVPDPKILF